MRNSVCRNIVQKLGAEHQPGPGGGYTGDFRWGSSLYRSPSECLDGILSMWLQDVLPDPAVDPGELAEELSEMYGDGELTGEEVSALAKRIQRHLTRKAKAEADS